MLAQDFRDFKRETVSHRGRTDRKTEHLRVHDTKGFNGIKPTRSFDQGSWRSYCDQVCVIKRRRSHNQVKETPGREAKDCKICSIFDQ